MGADRIEVARCVSTFTLSPNSLKPQWNYHIMKLNDTYERLTRNRSEGRTYVSIHLLLLCT
jgi:hypothetical protein